MPRTKRSRCSPCRSPCRSPRLICPGQDPCVKKQELVNAQAGYALLVALAEKQKAAGSAPSAPPSYEPPPYTEYKRMTE